LWQPEQNRLIEAARSTPSSTPAGSLQGNREDFSGGLQSRQWPRIAGREGRAPGWRDAASGVDVWRGWSAISGELSKRFYSRVHGSEAPGGRRISRGKSSGPQTESSEFMGANPMRIMNPM